MKTKKMIRDGKIYIKNIETGEEWLSPNDNIDKEKRKLLNDGFAVFFGALGYIIIFIGSLAGIAVFNKVNHDFGIMIIVSSVVMGLIFLGVNLIMKKLNRILLELYKE